MQSSQKMMKPTNRGNTMKNMVIVCILSVIWSAGVLAQTNTASKRINVALPNATLKELFTVIEKNSSFRFLYDATDINVNKTVSANYTDTSVDQILKEQLVDMTYEVKGNQIVVKSKPKSEKPSLQGITITGAITDNTGVTMPGVNIMVKGTMTGTVADVDGKYSIHIPDKNAILVFSFVGYATQEIAVGDRRTIDISLAEDTRQIDEVVVVGYGTMKKSDLTGSISSLKSDAITLGLAQSPDAALRGKSAGMQITTVSGQPGAEPVVRVRGNSSILGSNDPLYVVDGVPLSGGSAAGGLQGRTASPLTSINPSDIESIEVLKDASATAIYGSRGANGVVMITTKQGKEGVFKANFNMNLGIQQVGHWLKLTNPEQWAEMWNEAMDYLNSGNGKYDLNNLPAHTDWQKEIFRSAPLQSYELSFSGGTDKLRYMLSGGYTAQDGVISHTDFKRYTLRANIENKFYKWLTVGLNLSATRIDNNQAGEGNMDSDTPIGFISLATPVSPIYNSDGSYHLYWDVENKRPNPYASIMEITNNDLRNRLVSNVYLEVSILPGLKFRTNFATDIFNAKASHYTPSYIAQGLADHGVATIGSSNKLYWNSTSTLSYSKVINNIHNINAMAGAEWQKDEANHFHTTGTEFANDNAKFNKLDEAAKFSAASSYGAWQMQSFFARFNYGLLDRYLFTLTGRIDGSSRFGDEKNAFFPSGAFAWRMSEEDFLKDNPVISNMKFRASYGVSGEQGIPAYQTLSTLGPSKVYVGKDIYTGYFPTRPANPGLVWEKTRQADAGLDIGLWNNRVNLGLDYYYKKTVDLLYYKALPASFGFSSILQNIGSMQNTGFEITIDAYIIDNKDFKWNLNINNSFNKNKLLALGDGRTEIIKPDGGVSGGDIFASPSILKVGEPVGVFYGYISDGVIYNQEESEKAQQMGQVVYKPGELKIRDISGGADGSPDGKINTSDKTIIGNSNPKFTGGMTNSFSYKGFRLDILCQWSVGNDIMSYQHLTNQRLQIGYNATKDWYDKRWQPNNPSRTEPRAGYDIRAFPDVTYHVFDGSFFRINNITLSYQIPKMLVEKIKIKSARLFAGVDNLHTFTSYPGWSPDVSSMGGNVMGLGIDVGSYPVPRTYSFGVNIGF